MKRSNNYSNEEKVFKALASLPKSKCIICSKDLRGYSWIQFNHRRFKSWKIRIHAGDCMKLFRGEA